MKIGIVNDMALAVEALRRAVTLDSTHEVIWAARDGTEALALSGKERPDLILMDLIMPNMGGVDATRQIMAGNPCPILVVTANVGDNANLVFEAMACGALDAIDTPLLGVGDPRKSAAPLLNKIDSIQRRMHPERSVSPEAGAGGADPSARAPGLIAIGASAGGPGALAIILAALPKNLDAAIVIVQHIDEVFVNGMAEWLHGHSAIPVRLAKEDDRLQAGVVLLAGAGGHLVMKGPARLGYASEPGESIYKPSIDVFFDSVGRHLRGDAVGIVLTGMGADGARGLKTLRDQGHRTIAQDQATSTVYGMPKVAVTMGAATDVLPVQAIAPKLAGIFGARH